MKMLRLGYSRVICLSLFVTTATKVASVDASAYVGGTAHSKVVHLGQDTFVKALEEDPANTVWFLKFYAPWCGHCKRLAPILDRVAPKIEGQMAVGKIDCTIEKALCNTHKIRGYPTLKFAVDGEIYDYAGQRDEKSIMSLASKMSAPAVSSTSSYEQALKFALDKSEEGIVFVGYDPDATGNTLEDKLRSTSFGQIFSQVARKKKAMAYFLWIDVPAESSAQALKDFDVGAVQEGGTVKPFVNRLELNVKPRYWGQSESNDQDLGTFVREQNIPLVAVLGPGNFQKVGNSGRPLVIGVVDFSKMGEANEIKSKLSAYATTGPKDITENYYYGVIDGTKWSKFLEQFNVKQEDIPQYFVLDVPTKTFWQNTTYSSIGTFLRDIADGTIESQLPKHKSGAAGFLARVEHIFISYFPYSLLVIILFVFSLVFLLAPVGSSDEELFTDDFDEDLIAEDMAEQKAKAEGGDPDGNAGLDDSTATETKKDK